MCYKPVDRARPYIYIAYVLAIKNKYPGLREGISGELD